MADAIPIIDVWTQHISGTPPGTNPEGENVFRNYGMLEVFHHGTDPAKMIDAMDRAGVRAALMAGDNEAVAQAQQRHPGRIFGEYHASPVHIMKAVRELEHYVRERGFVALRIVCGHLGWPWTEEMIAVAWKHKNVWIDTSAHVPKHYPPAFVHFMKTFGKDKVCFATDYPLLQWERVLGEVDALGLSEEVKHRFLHDNAARAFNLKV